MTAIADVVPSMAVDVAKYVRGQPTAMKHIKDKRLKNDMRRAEKRMREAATAAANAEVLLPTNAGHLEAEGMERTYKFRQEAIVPHLDVTSAKKHFNLTLDTFGPYTIDYTRNGRHLLLGGRKGHVATFDWRTGTLHAEIQLRETVRDVQWLHDESMFAVAQKKYVYVYDRSGMEVHCLRDHLEVNRLDFLPYHHLLVSVGSAGYLHYTDTSTGKAVAALRTRLGPCDVLAQNPSNAIMHLGHANGTVTLWSPNMTQPLVKMLCHKGPVLAAAVDPSGAYMATSGLDGQLKVFDLRTYKMMHAYYTPAPAHSLDISQRGVLAVGHGPRVTLWKDALREKQQSPYMNHLQEGAVVRNVRFCRYDDVLGIGHSEGMTSIVVPGAGEPNYDALEVNPFATKKQRQEAEVRGLLDKIQPEMISLQIDGVGALDPQSADGRREAKLKAEQALAASSPAEIAKKKARGRSKTMRRYLNKQQNVIDAKRVAVREERDMRQKEHAEREAKRDAKRGGGSSTGEEGDAMRESARKALPLALGRFATKGRK